MDRDRTFTVRLLDAADDLEWGAAVAGESRSEYAREAIRQRTERMRDEGLHQTTEEEDDRA